MARFIPTFSGTTSASHFIDDFNAHCIVEKITDDRRKIACFSLYLKGSARSWFDDLPHNSDDELKKWDNIETLFRERYITSQSNYFIESQIFDSLQLSPSQRVDEFFSLLQEKSRLLNKSDQDLLIRFVAALPPKLAFFVRVANPTSSQDALNHARNGEAYGYRTDDKPTNAMPQMTQNNIRHQSHASELEEKIISLERRLADIQITQQYTSNAVQSHPRRPISNVNSRRRIARPTSPHCNKCWSTDHTVQECNMIDSGRPRPDLTCQLCRQSGHAATFCTRYVNTSNNTHPSNS